MILLHQPLIILNENNQIKEKEAEIVNELKEFVDRDILVLGCTHYPSIKEIINNMNIKTLDMGEVLIDNIKIDNKGNGTCELYFSLISVNLINNINSIIGSNYFIYTK